MARLTREQREQRDLATYEAAVVRALQAGEFKPIRMSCGRCGGKLLVRAIPYHAGGGVIGTRTSGACDVCQRDRVKRWGDLFLASANEGNELRVFPVRASARVLASAGLVKYNNQDHAWELTDAGLALLRRFDAAGGRA